MIRTWVDASSSAARSSSVRSREAAARFSSSRLRWRVPPVLLRLRWTLLRLLRPTVGELGGRGPGLAIDLGLLAHLYLPGGAEPGAALLDRGAGAVQPLV